MARLLEKSKAFGAPGIEPRWTHSNKAGVGTAYSAASRIWFTIWQGIVTEVYYPTVDKPQIRDLQCLITDGKTFLHEERNDLQSQIEKLDHHVLGYRITSTAPDGEYTLTKEIISDPYAPCILQHTQLDSQNDDLSLYALCAPHLNDGGWGNTAHVIEVCDRRLLAANKDDCWLAIGATVPFSKLSCGYAGASDGWQDLTNNYQLDWEFDSAVDGNLGLISELDLTRSKSFVLGLAFGNSLESAVATLMQSLNVPFAQQKETFQTQWDRAYSNLQFSLPTPAYKSDNPDQRYDHLLKSSFSLLLAHEDKTYSGALIASMSFPWGEAKGDGDTGGYHLVWTRDMVNSATGLMAAGHTETAVRSLIYLMTVQHEDGGFAQNFWLDGQPYWRGMQLDEVAFPILLAWKLNELGELPNSFDVYPMVMRAAAYLVRQGPATEQERWELNGGYSPSTLACTIAALICAAGFARERSDRAAAAYIEDYADFLKDHIEAWTVTTEGTLVPGIKRHFIRITPAQVDVPHPNEDPNHSTIRLSSRPPGTDSEFAQNESAEYPAKEIVDAGFLLFVRYGILSADDPLVVDSLKVVDAVLKVDTPCGPCWRRYNHDSYGQQPDGSAYKGIGQGRAWPLLTGERGHYELAAGHDVVLHIKAIEQFATNTGLLTEQIWDQADLPEAHMYLGRPTGAAMPLMWAHAEYIKLLRSAQDGQVYDLIPLVAERYLGDRRPSKQLEVWKFHRQVQKVKAPCILRIQTTHPFTLHWTDNDWQTSHDTSSQRTSLALDYVDIAIASDQMTAQTKSIQFTFFWLASQSWENQNYLVEVDRL